MQALSGTLRDNLSYLFIVVGTVWLGLAYVTGSLLLLWPVVACVISGVLLKAAPSAKLTVAWAGASALMGIVLSAYQAYSASPLVAGQFAEIASLSLVGFVLFGLAHLYLLAASRSGK
jgi:hypothetical protein